MFVLHRSRSCRFLFRNRHFDSVLFPKKENMDMSREEQNNFMNSVLFDDDVSRYDLLETLNKIVSILNTEIDNATKVEYQLRNKYEWYSSISDDLTGKIESLQNLVDCPDRLKVKTFADHVSASWLFANIQVSRAYSKIQLASSVWRGIPLSVMLKKLKKETAAVNVALQIGRVVYNEDFVLKCCGLVDEVNDLTRNLERCDAKVQQYLAITKLIPYVLTLVDKLENFAATTNLSQRRDSSDLSAFSILSQLLTGELLGEEPTDSHSILVENAAKKPVLITKNKRKWSGPWIASKMTETYF